MLGELVPVSTLLAPTANTVALEIHQLVLLSSIYDEKGILLMPGEQVSRKRGMFHSRAHQE